MMEDRPAKAYEGMSRRQFLARMSVAGFGLICLSVPLPLSAQSAPSLGGLDARVSRFLEDARLSWSDWNIPYHNVLWSGDPHLRNFMEQVKRVPGFRTTVERGSGEGVSVSCRRGK